jgi:anaerobic selenocysteine-containing dehydrogenase
VHRRGRRDGVPIADEFVQIRIGGDMALFAGLGRLLLEAMTPIRRPASSTVTSSPATPPDRDYERRHPRGRSRHRADRHRIERSQLDKVAAMTAKAQRTSSCAGRWA